MKPIYISKLGADPEVFFVRARSKAPQSVEGLIGGTKHAPLPMEGMPEGFFVQEDNVAAEYNVPPTRSVAEWANNIYRGYRYLNNIARKHRLRCFLAADLDFPVPQVMTPHALTLGCEPDFNAWTESMNPRPEPPFQMRTAAAHIHVSWDDPDEEQRWELVRALDVYLGLPSILATPPNRRRQLYGKAGACRLKNYGVEYRVLDNFFIGDEKLAQTVGARVFQCAEDISNNDLLRNEIRNRSGEIQHAINSHDVNVTKDLMDYFSVRGF